jgi:hypothetical protein
MVGADWVCTTSIGMSRATAWVPKVCRNACAEVLASRTRSFPTAVRRFVAPQSGIAHQQNGRARSAPLPGLGVILSVSRWRAARLERRAQRRP